MRFARAFPSILLLAFVLLFAVAPGCGAGPEPPAAELLRQSFPQQAAEVLDRREVFVAVDEGFVSQAVDGPEVALGADTAIRAALPRSGQSAIRLRSPASDFEVRVRELDAEGEGALAGGAVAYPRKGGTSFWAATEAGVEEWLHLDAGLAQAGRVVATWAIEGGAVRQQGEMITIDDAAGVPRLRVTAPAAFAAGGRPVEAKLTARGATIELTVDAGGEAVLVDPLWVATASMAATRMYATATVLADGRVLVVGGNDALGAAQSTCEIYDPTTNTWSAAGALAAPRSSHTAALLGNGKVLVAGGYSKAGALIVSAEVYDPATAKWSPAGTLANTRVSHAMALVGTGKVLIAGGVVGGALSASAELYDPVTNTWSAAAPMGIPRRGLTLTLLSSGAVLAVGGKSSASTSVATAEIYTASTNTWVATGSMQGARENHTATLLQSGKVLAVAGINWFTSTSGQTLSSTALYDPATGTWTGGGTLARFREYHATVLLPNGGVLTMGGNGGEASVEFYSPALNSWSDAGPLLTGRGFHVAAALANGKVIVAGGYSGTYLASAELYSPYVGGTACTSSGECQSGFCVDGFCCNTGCTSACQACSTAKTGAANGTCGNVIAATDPDNDCAAQAASTCGTNGSCNGAGKCQLYVSGISCAAASCSGSTLNKGSSCDGNGTCTSAGTQSCGAYLCVGAACLTTCTLTTECTVGNVCIAGKCVPPLATGSVCTAASQCQSGFCADGFCCNTACGGLCQACSAAKSGSANGTCGNVDVATDPDSECAAQATATCGTNGSCNGAGACQLYPAATTCLAPSCSGLATLNTGSACNGTGTCTPKGMIDCAPYICAGAACKTSCAGDAECTGGTLCINNLCGQPQPDGSTCGTAGQCQSGNCVDGVCCNTACSAGACDACSKAAGAPTDGVCSPLTGNPCDDGDLCTQADTCSVGKCAGSPKMCGAIDTCHVAGVCDSTTGACTTPPAADGTTCDDGNGCTQADTCSQGKCTSGTPVTCAAPDGCHEVGACDPKTGACNNPEKPDGVTCDDQDACTEAEVCAAGVCTPAMTKVCAAADACHDPGTCDKATGVCSQKDKDVACSADPFCETIVEKCSLATGACVKAPLPDGVPCDTSGECLGGKCKNGASSSSSAGSAGTSGSSGATGSGATSGTGVGGNSNTTSSGSDTTSGAGAGAGAGSGAGGDDGEGTVTPAGGCGCTTAGSSESRAPWLLFGLVLVVGRRRRPRAAA